MPASKAGLFQLITILQQGIYRKRYDQPVFFLCSKKYKGNAYFCGMSDQAITVATTDDVPALVKLVNRAYRGEVSRQGWTTEADYLDGIRIDEEGLIQLMEHPDAVVLKYTDDTHAIIGSVYLQKRDSKLYLGMLTVDPALQARGTGKLLLQAAEAYARMKGCSSVVMNVISKRQELISWYERYGYYQTGETLPFPTDPRFGIPKEFIEFSLMEKNL